MSVLTVISNDLHRTCKGTETRENAPYMDTINTQEYQFKLVHILWEGIYVQN